MRIHSIKLKIALLTAGMIMALICFLMLINLTFSEKYYFNRKQKIMLSSYDYIDEIMGKYYNGDISSEKMNSSMEALCAGKAISVLVVGSDWSTIYVSTQGEASMLERLRMSIFNGDVFERLPKNNNNERRYNESDGKKDKYHDTEIDMSDKSPIENRTIIETTDNYTLQKVYDSRLGDDFFELWGTLSNGYTIIIRTPIQNIKDNVQISNGLFKSAGVFGLFVGIIAALVLASYITRPIAQLTGIARRMSNMDFDARYEGNDKDEIGILGRSMNHMSEKLEENISQLKTANMELRKDIDKKDKLEKMRSDFLSNVSHELKTPIALIQGYAEGLKEGITDDPESMDFYCNVIMDEANKMNDLVKKLLTLNQLEFGKDESNMERFDINMLVESIINANLLRATQNNIRIIFNNCDEHNYVWADEYKIEEVVTNYISNAINHCDKDRIIEVRVFKNNEDMRVSVFNTGNNIPEEELENIWEKFYKVDKARTREYGGNGIGLSIVKAIMDSYGKDYGVRNMPDGVEFWFDLDCKL